jgi:hypothetical protein
MKKAFIHTKRSCEQKSLTLFLLKLNLPFHFNLELSHVALSLVLPLFHMLPYFPILKLSSLYLVIFKHPYFTHMKSDYGNF